MTSSPHRTVLAIAEALFEPSEGAGHLDAMVDDVLAFLGAASFASRVTLRAALWLLRFAPVFLLASWRPLERLDRDRRREILARVERTPFGLAFVAWRTLLILHFYEDVRELARIGYREERRRHLAVVATKPVIPVPAESGVRLRDDSDDRALTVNTGKKGAA